MSGTTKMSEGARVAKAIREGGEAMTLVEQLAASQGWPYPSCEACDRSLRTSEGCRLGFARRTRDGKVKPRIKAGEGGCRDCGASGHRVHHVGCSAECCPFCGAPAIGCPCQTEMISEGPL